MKTKVSPLAPPRFPSVPDVEGVRFATAKAGIKYEDRTDVLFATFDAGTSVAGILTRSKCPSAAVDWCRAGLSGGAARALLVNSGNANAFTGIKGRTAVSRSASLAATAAGCAPGEVMLASTGVIGEPLDPEKFGAVLEDMKTRLGDGPWSDAAKAIMTTDTFAKASGAEIELDGQTVSITGIAKGSGMIAPDMATMLAFIFTDVPISSKLLQTLLERHAVTSFNAITVDGDTSTSDTLLAFATGKAAARGVGPIVSDKDPRFEEFGDALRMVMFDLATQIVRDGEGATKFVTITVQGAVNDKSARKVAFSIANSPLVKTAIAGGDANWGRIVMAVGKAGEPAERDILSIRFGPHLVAEAGERASDYSEQKTSRYMRGDEIEITVGLGLGTGTGTVYTCDLTHAYIDINADYRS